MLSASQGTYINIQIDGVDQEAAMKSMVTLFDNKFDEKI